MLCVGVGGCLGGWAGVGVGVCQVKLSDEDLSMMVTEASKVSRDDGAVDQVYLHFVLDCLCTCVCLHVQQFTCCA